MHRQRFSGRSVEACWCIAVDKMPGLGLNLVSDAEFAASFYKDGIPANGNFLGVTERDQWADPRQGNLFYLLHQLLKKKE